MKQEHMPLRPPSVGELPLDVRDGLPDELRVLLKDFPRESWSNHPDFNGLTAFWIAGVEPIVAASPMPLAPSGLIGVGVSVECVSKLGISAADGMP